MLYFIIIFFALAAVMGLIIASAIFSHKPATPKPAVIAHGIFAATALGCLIYYAVNNPENYPKASLILFCIGALGGAVLLFNDLKKKPGPLPFVVIHALIGVTAFALLLVYVLF